MLAANATVTAVKAAEREKRAAKKRKRVARLAAEKKALKEAASDPKRPFPGLKRAGAVIVKKEMLQNGAYFAPWKESLPESPAAKAERAEIEAKKKSNMKAKARQREERREAEWCAHISHVRAVKRECADEPSMVPPPPPPVSFSL